MNSVQNSNFDYGLSQTNTKLNLLENNIHASNNNITGNSTSNLGDITDKHLNNDMILHTDNTKKNDSILNDAEIEFLETEYNSNMQQNSSKHCKLKIVNNIEIDIDNFYNFSNTNFDQSLNGNNPLKHISSTLSGKNYKESSTSNNDTEGIKPITNNSTNAGSLSNNNFGKKYDDSSYLNKDTLVNRILDGNEFTNSKQDIILDNYDPTQSRHSMKKNNSSKYLKEKNSPRNSSKDLK